MVRSCICLAHRGASGHEPENTLRSFEKALALGAPWVEFDVRVVQGEPIIFHDRTLNRMAGCSGVIEQQTLERIRAISLPKGEKIPHLNDALEVLRGKASAQIELKGPGSGAAVATALRQKLDEGWDSDSFLVSSFDHHELVTFKRADLSIRLGLLTYGYPLNCIDAASSLGAFSVHLHIDATTEVRIRELQSAGFQVYVYTANDPIDIQQLKKMGVDGIFSDFPERVLATH